MNWILNVILAVLLVQIYLEYPLVFGDGIDIAECKINCACCKDRDCGPGSYFAEGTCYRGCIDGYFGARCYQRCVHNCTKCNPLETCTFCYAGYHPGTNRDCTEKCPSSCKTCIASKVCTECKEDFYNANESTDCPFRRCPEHCLCEQGKCVSCTAGYYDTGSECNNACPTNCVACSSNEICIVCQDGYYNGYDFDNNNDPLFRDCRHKCRDNCSSCSSYNNCQSCKVGRYGSICNRECSIGCEDSLCVIESGKCECKTNFSGETCTECKHGKFGPLCNDTCALYCKHNHCNESTGNCLDGCSRATITGVTCNTCLDGMFGELCNKTCPTKCQNEKCNRINGTCSDGCKMHFDGPECKSCDKGRYGEDCEYICPERCSKGVCINDSGNCQGCKGTFIGDKCENCQTGYYGPYCNNKCSENCFIDICDRNSGVCIHGCKSNYFGDKCCLQNSNCVKCSSNTECNACKSGFYGETCNKTCHNICIDNLCRKETGVCVLGCHEEYDHMCAEDLEIEKAEDKSSTVVIVMGIILAVLALVVFSGIAVVVWKRKYTPRNADDAIVTFENACPSSNSEQKENNDMSTRRDHDYYNTKQDQSDDSFGAGNSMQSEYEKVKSLEVSEHEYEHVSFAV